MKDGWKISTTVALKDQDLSKGKFVNYKLHKHVISTVTAFIVVNMEQEEQYSNTMVYSILIII